MNKSTLSVFVLAIFILAITPISRAEDCYSLGCKSFNQGSCPDGYTLAAKAHCGGLEGRLTNKQEKFCCKDN